MQKSNKAANVASSSFLLLITDVVWNKSHASSGLPWVKYRLWLEVVPDTRSIRKTANTGVHLTVPVISRVRRTQGLADSKKDPFRGALGMTARGADVARGSLDLPNNQEACVDPYPRGPDWALTQF
jgi:hypothetical protein